MTAAVIYPQVDHRNNIAGLHRFNLKLKSF